MPIAGVEQPSVIQIGDDLRLRKFDGNFSCAIPWYQDTEMVYLMDGKRKTYSPEEVEWMYRYLDQKGELYFIEVLEDGAFRPIGDVTFWQEDMPIVIGDAAFRGRHLGRRVVQALVERGKSLGYTWMMANEIYHFNTASRRCFESVGFRPVEETPDGVQMRWEEWL